MLYEWEFAAKKCCYDGRIVYVAQESDPQILIDLFSGNHPLSEHVQGLKAMGLQRCCQLGSHELHLTNAN